MAVDKRPEDLRQRFGLRHGVGHDIANGVARRGVRVRGVEIAQERVDGELHGPGPPGAR